MKERAKFISKSSRNYISDIINWRSDAIAFKTADFLRRNFVWVFNFIKNTYSHAVLELKKIKQGFIAFFNDVFKAAGLQVKGTR